MFFSLIDVPVDAPGPHAHARRRDGHHRVGRCHRRLLCRVLRTTKGRGAHGEDGALVARPRLHARVPHDHRRRPRVADRRGRALPARGRARCAASRSSSASRPCSTWCSRTASCTRSCCCSPGGPRSCACPASASRPGLDVPGGDERDHHRDAPPPAPVPEDIPGVTRRHRPSDFYHERTNFQFIKHSTRWLILSSTFMVLAVLLVGVRGLNFGIDFEGGTAWQVQMAGGKSAKVAEVRDLLRPLGFSDAKVSVLSGERRERPRAGAGRRRPDAQGDPKALATYAQVDRGRGAVPAERATAARSRSPPKDGVNADEGRRRRPRSQPIGITNPTGDGQRPRRHGHGPEAAGRAPCSRSPTRSRSTPDATVERRQHLDRRPDVGSRGQPEGAQGAVLLLPPARGLPVGPLRVEDGGVGDRRGDPRHHLHGRRLRAVPVPGHARDGHRVPHDPRFLALRHRRRVRQGRGSTNARSPRPGRIDLRRDGQQVAEPGADAVAVDVARRAAAGACRC